MPRIPLYNKGLGPTIESPTGALSPRASAGAFMQQGQAQAQFFQTASKIAFDFAQERKLIGFTVKHLQSLIRNSLTLPLTTKIQIRLFLLKATTTLLMDFLVRLILGLILIKDRKT